MRYAVFNLCGILQVSGLESSNKASVDKMIVFIFYFISVKIFVGPLIAEFNTGELLIFCDVIGEYLQAIFVGPIVESRIPFKIKKVS